MKNFLSLSRSLVLVWLCAISSFVAAQPYAYVPSLLGGSDSSVFVINTANDAVTAILPVNNGNAQTIVVSPDGSKAYVGVNTAKTLVFNTSNNTVVDTANGIAGRWISPDGSKIYGFREGGILSAINTANNTVVDLMQLTSNPMSMDVSPDGSKLYILLADWSSGSNNYKLDIVDAATFSVIGSKNLPSTVDWVTDVKVTPNGSKVYIAARKVDSNALVTYVLNTSTNVIVANVAGMGEALCISPDGSKLYAANWEGEVNVMNTANNTIMATIAVPLSDWTQSLDITPDGSKLYVPMSIGNKITVINTATNTVTGSIPVSYEPSIFGNMMPKAYPAVPCSSVSIFPNNIAQINNGSSYVQSLVQTGMVLPTWTVSAGTLPPGISLNGSFLTGTCTVNGTYSFTVTATKGACSVSKSYTVQVACASANITTSSLQNVIPGVNVRDTLRQEGFTAPVWSISAGALPSGVTLANNGVITGNALTPGTYNFTATVTQGICSASKSLSMTVVNCPTVSITPSSLANATRGSNYTVTLQQTGYTSPTFSVSSGNLPSGMLLNATTGVLSGTPTVAGTFLFTVKATKGICSTTQNYTLQVVCDNPIIYGTLNSASVGNNYSTTTFYIYNASNSVFSISAGSLPDGLTLSNTGVLSGVPTTAGSYTFTVKATRGICSVTQDYTLVVNCQYGTSITTNVLSTIPKGVPYNQTITSTLAGATFNVSGGTLPNGISLSSGGLLSGTPTEAGIFIFTAKATAGICFVTKTCTLEVMACSITLSQPHTLSEGAAGVVYSQTLSASATNVNFSLSSGMLPNGLSLSSNGTISGTPSVAGAFDFTVTATNTECSASQVYSLVVGSCATIAPSHFISIKRGTAFSKILSTGQTSSTFSLAHGTLPNGITLSPNGLLSGTPADSGLFNFTVTAVSGACTVSKTYQWLISGTVFAYVPGISSISVINTSTNILATTIPIGNNASGVSVSPDGNKVYVTRGYSNSISVISTTTNSLLANISVAGSPLGISVSPDGNKVYVTKFYSNSVAVINALTNQIVATIPVGNSPTNLSINPDGSKVYVSNRYSNSVSVINTFTNQVIATIPVGANPSAILLSPDGTKAYVTTSSISNFVSVIDVRKNTVVATIPVGYYPSGISITPDGSKVYLVNSTSDLVSVIDVNTNAIVSTISIGHYPNGVSITPDGSKVYVVNRSSNSVSVISTSTNTVVATINTTSDQDALGNMMPLTYACPSVMFNEIGKGVQGAAYTQQLKPSRLTSPTFAITSGTLPTGLTLNPNNGLLSGTPTQAGTYTFTVMAATGICRGVQTYSMEIAAACSAPATPAILGSTSFCGGGATTLSVANPAPNTKYLWSNGALGMNYPASAAGSYSVQAISNGCTSAVSAPIEVTSGNSVPNAAFTRNGNDLIAANIPNATYQWLLSGQPIAGAISRIYKITQQVGNYSVMITAGGCAAISTESTLTDVKPSAEDLDKKLEINVYPNPNTGKFTLEASEKGNAVFYNLLGKVVLDTEISEGKNDIDLSQFGAGMYVVKLRTANHITTKKVTVE